MKTLESYTQRPAEHAFTYRYAQPKEYHFCLDSIIFSYVLSKKIAESSVNPHRFRAIDLCAGCGVVGLELSYYHPWIVNFDFVEVQDIFENYFHENLSISKNDQKNYRFYKSDLWKFSLDPSNLEQYDFLVANPPYFRQEEGTPSPQPIKQRARFFENLTLAQFIEAMIRLLKPKGVAYFLMRPGLEHGRLDEVELKAATAGRASWRFVADVRGTHVVELLRSD